MRRMSIFVLLVLLFCAAAGYGDLITKGPYLLALGDRWIVVKWESGGASGNVKYGFTSGNYEFSQVSTIFEGMNEATLMCLKPGKYFYRVAVGGKESEEYVFSTGPAPDEAFNFIVFGDTRNGHTVHQALVYLMNEYPADLVMHTGDIVYIGSSASDWETFFAIQKPLMVHIPHIFVLGNHELLLDGSGYYFDKYFSTDFNRYTPRRYATTIGNSRFIVLNSDEDVEAGSEQYEWLSQELERASKMPRIKHVFVGIHRPPYNSCQYANENKVEKIRQYIAPLLESYKVDIVFSAHCHYYERSESNGVTYIVTGGGGAPFYQCNQHPNDKQVYCEVVNHFVYVTVQNELVHVEAYRIDGSLIESFDIYNDFGGAGEAGADEPDPCYNFDYDQDRLTDGYEQYESDCLDPYNADTDGDSWKDGEEVNAGTDPCDPQSYPEGSDIDDDASGLDSACGCQ